VSVCLFRRQRAVVLEVTDDGSGFEPREPHAGLGLASMRERASAAGGKLVISSAAGAGTRVRLTVPVPAAPAQDQP
jgi:signal transduction histidine kinase